MEPHQKVLLIRLPCHPTNTGQVWGYVRLQRKEVCVLTVDAAGTLLWTTCPIRSIESCVN